MGCFPVRGVFPMGWRGAAAPTPYESEVEYLRTDGYEYILTGVTPDSTIAITGSFRWNEIVVQSRLFSSNYSGREYSLYRGNSRISMRGGSTTTAQFGAGSNGTTYPFSYTPTSGTMNGITEEIGGNHPSHDIEFALFGRNNNGTVAYSDYKMLCDFYWMKIEKDGVLVRDFVPWRVGIGVEAVGCIKDKLGVGGMNPDGSARNDGLYFNRGTGAFVIGPDKTT